MGYDIEALMAILQSRLKPVRWQHSLEVARMAVQLARHYGEDVELAEVAGLLHDYAKDLNKEELLAIAEQQELFTDLVEMKLPGLLHAPVGAWLIQQDLQIYDQRILNAVWRHTMGAIDMSPLDQIIFLADMIEPGRNYPQQERLYALAFQNLDQAMLQALDSTIQYCLERRQLLHPRTIYVRNYYLTK